MKIMESKLHEVSPHCTHCIMLVICKLPLVNCNSYCVRFRLPNWCSWEICSSRMLCSLIGCLLWSVSRPCPGLIFEGHWATITQCLSTVLRKNGFLNFLLATYHPLLTYAVSTSLLYTTTFSLDTLFIILVQQPYFLHNCAFSIIFFLQNVHEIFSVFRPSLLFPTCTAWHRIYTKLAEFQFNTLLYVWNCKNLSEGCHSSKLGRHRITSTNLSMFCADSMRSVNPL